MLTETKERSLSGKRHAVSNSGRASFSMARAPLTDDRQFIDAVLRGEPDAEHLFTTRYSRYIYQIAARQGIRVDEREDLCQDVFLHLWADGKRRLRLWQARSGYRFTAYLAVIAAHVIYDRYRRQRITESRDVAVSEDRLLEAHLTLTDDAPLDILLQRCRALAIEEAMEGLTVRDAILLRRRHFLGESYKEIAAQMGMTVNHVGVSLSRAERRLRQQLERPHYRELFQEESASQTDRSFQKGQYATHPHSSPNCADAPVTLEGKSRKKKDAPIVSISDTYV